MIRQAVSCDICGADMRQTNHWFIARQLGDELRITGWNARVRARTGAKHLCGQTCVHKLLDEFLARNLASRPAAAEADHALQSLMTTNVPVATGCAARVAHSASRSVTPIAEPCFDDQSSARLKPAAPEALPAVAAPLPPTSITSRAGHAEAWKRELARIQSEPQARPGRRRSIA